MFNAEDIILLEKQWIKYKIKTKMKFFLFSTILFLSFVFIFFSYFYFFKEKNSTQVKTIVEPSSIVTVEQNTSSEQYSAVTFSTPKNESNASSEEIAQETNSEKINPPVIAENTSNLQVQEESNKPIYYLKITPTLKNNDLFTSNVATLNLHIPFQDQKNVKNQVEAKVTIPKNSEKKVPTITKKETNINISTSEVDTITYLKDKFFTTENIVFAIILSEEFYNKKDYDESIKWALTANEIDPKNDKTWYWFAKNKIKLGQKDDAIKALKAFLSENNSNRLKTLLKEIENGDE